MRIFIDEKTNKHASTKLCIDSANKTCMCEWRLIKKGITVTAAKARERM